MMMKDRPLTEIMTEPKRKSELTVTLGFKLDMDLWGIWQKKLYFTIKL